MANVYIDDKYVYSIDMIYAYINLFKFKTEQIKTSSIIDNLELLCWNKIKPNDILELIKNKNNKNDTYINKNIDKINKANIETPVIITDQNIVIDKMHVLAKIKLENKKMVNVYIIDKLLLKKFRILRYNEIDKLNTLNINNYIEIFVKNIIISKIDENKQIFNNVKLLV